MQGTEIQSLAWEDSTRRKATKPVIYNYLDGPREPAGPTTEPVCPTTEARAPRACPQQGEPHTATKITPARGNEDSRRSPQLEKSPHTATKTSAAENK